MIEKWYALRCDACGELINYWQEDSMRDAIERERNNVTRVIALYDGKCFCDYGCRDIWLNNRITKRREEREMNKVMKKFGGEE